jgi:hypothetical protein
MESEGSMGTCKMSHVLSIMKVRGFCLEELGRMKEHQLVMMRLGFAGSGIEDLAQLGAVQKIDREESKVGSL